MCWRCCALEDDAWVVETIGGVVVVTGFGEVCAQTPCGRDGDGGSGSWSGVRFPNCGGKGGVLFGCGVDDGVGSSWMGESGWLDGGGGM